MEDIRVSISTQDVKMIEDVRRKVRSAGLTNTRTTRYEIIDIGDFNECDQYIELRIYYCDPDVIEVWVNGRYKDKFEKSSDALKAVKLWFIEVLEDLWNKNIGEI